MEQNTKNFDRGIEKMMNEHEVAPPFGMWNRISSELEAMPAAVAAAGPPVATSLIPKRAMVGIIAAVLVIGAAMATDYMVSHNNKSAQVNTAAVTTPIASAKNATKAATEQTISVKHTIAVNPAAITLNKVTAKHIAASNPVQSTILAAKQVQPVVNQPVAVTNTETPAATINNNTEVPTPIQSVVQTKVEAQSYYFPPIDGNTQARENNSLAAAKARINDLVPYNGDERPKLIGSRNKFHPKRRQKFQYGNIIR